MKYVKEHSKSSLMSRTKAELAEMVIIAEKNTNNAYEALDQQAKNISKLLQANGDNAAGCDVCKKYAVRRVRLIGNSDGLGVIKVMFCPSCGRDLRGNNNEG